MIGNYKRFEQWGGNFTQVDICERNHQMHLEPTFNIMQGITKLKVRKTFGPLVLNRSSLPPANIVLFGFSLKGVSPQGF